MGPNGYAHQLQQLRSIEKSRSLDLTDRALTALDLRLTTISDGPGTEEQKQRQRTRAMEQWQTFMQREIPANG